MCGSHFEAHISQTGQRHKTSKQQKNAPDADEPRTFLQFGQMKSTILTQRLADICQRGEPKYSRGQLKGKVMKSNQY